MSTFRTTLSSFEPNFRIDHNKEVLCIGSCFALHMAKKLESYKFKCTSNPYGILYHPLNISNALLHCLDGYSYSQQDLVQRDSYYHSWWHHSQHHHQQAEVLLDELNQIQRELLEKIKNTSLFIFTFGTAYYYRHLQSNILVGNCHKIDSKKFKKEIAREEEIASQYQILLQKIIAINPKAQFIFTVSPVRHVKDGIINNTRSKATLHLAISNIQNMMSQATYFPAYEIMMDDLRDYRFYNSDLLHPSNTAIEYIWGNFSAHLFTEQTVPINETIKSIRSALSHRPFKVESSNHQVFLKKTINKIKEVQSEYNFLNFSQEIKSLENQIL